MGIIIWDERLREESCVKVIKGNQRSGMSYSNIAILRIVNELMEVNNLVHKTKKKPQGFSLDEIWLPTSVEDVIEEEKKEKIKKKEEKEKS